ncbi:sigma-70 family RNA polymerase sigma factor [Curtobacterium sp. SORGH_AS_0776]|uniref:sigma-70 family RNA polymerase sigma factor n=1 Tax=Curtobacterium sp. SORGH_AS_0776 TaxID=3041798 RepID=UPI00285A966B|nr:sigma-70 family RNA polymerase sigma factor [Curtobacterium sp. SORGH_AS_0776]MDR6170003.1 RNA polymerase sigma-70 factor (ECF subfamily) [Curtobacterium sp. SORGH_AS_0776]
MDDGLLAKRDEERALLIAVAAGDRHAFTRLHDRFRPLVERYVRHQLVDAWQAEEVVQDVFLEIWQIADRFDPAHSAIAWIRTIAQRRAIDRVRKSRADRDRDLRIGTRDADLVDHSSVERAESVLDRAELRRAVAALPGRQRDAVVLRHLVGMTGPEVAARLGVPVGTAKTRARDGVIALRRVMVP